MAKHSGGSRKASWPEVRSALLLQLRWEDLTPDQYKSNTGGPGNPLAPPSWNRYAYAGNDPINFNDPTGQVRCSVTTVFTTLDPDNPGTIKTNAYVSCTSVGGAYYVSFYVDNYEGDWQSS